VRHLYRPSSLPVNLQHADDAAPPMTLPELAASATDDEEKGMAMTPLRRASEMKLTSSVIQAAATSTVRCTLLLLTTAAGVGRAFSHVCLFVCLSVFKVSKVNVDLYSASSQPPLMRSDSDHSFTCKLHNACLYSPAAEHHRPLAGTHFTVSRRVEG